MSRNSHNVNIATVLSQDSWRRVVVCNLYVVSTWMSSSKLTFNKFFLSDFTRGDGRGGESIYGEKFNE